MVFGPPGYISILTISKVLRVLLYMKAGILSTDTFLVEWKRAVYITIDYRVLATNRWCIYKTNIVCAAEGDSVCFDHSWATPTRKFWNRMFPSMLLAVFSCGCGFFLLDPPKKENAYHLCGQNICYPQIAINSCSWTQTFPVDGGKISMGKPIR